MRRRLFTGWDAALLFALLALNLWLFWRPHPPAAAVEISSDAGSRVVPLAPARRLEIRGPLGVTVVEVEPGGARFLSSPCPNRLCVRSGPVRRVGETAACVPNRVVLRVVRSAGTGQEGVDAVTR